MMSQPISSIPSGLSFVFASRGQDHAIELYSAHYKYIHIMLLPLADEKSRTEDTY